MARCRLDFAQADGFRKYVEPLVGQSVVYPHMLPTQASGRWSTSDPPKVNFPDDKKADLLGLPHLRSVFIPHPGTWWLKWDHDAIEAKLAAAYSGDQEDLEAFRLGYDIHTITACRMFKLPLPPNLRNPDAPECEEWRARVSWQGSKGDRRRHLAKTARYALSYGSNENSILNAAGIEQLGLTQAELLNFARVYLETKPALVAWKSRVWSRCAQERMARTFMGRRRMLYGEGLVMAREGLNHEIQGSVADINNTNLVAIEAAYPEMRVITNAHDGNEVSFPVINRVNEVDAVVRTIVEREWDINDSKIKFYAEWGWVDDQGQSHRLPKSSLSVTPPGSD